MAKRISTGLRTETARGRGPGLAWVVGRGGVRRTVAARTWFVMSVGEGA
jgi:hypothetical protein